MTAPGLRKLEDELRQLKSEERPSIIRAIAEARSHGDLSENAEYHAARERQSFVEGRILELEEIVSSVEVIDPSTLSGDQVKFGAQVRLIDEETDKEATYQIVGAYEADIKSGRISVSSPLAKSLIGKKTGDTVSVPAPGGDRSYEILAISYAAAGTGLCPERSRVWGRRPQRGSGAEPLSLIGIGDVRDAAERIRGKVLRTPTIASAAVSSAAGCEVLLKLDNLQAVGSFKERGAANKLALLSEAERRWGVVAVSAGNHAQGVARHASLLGIRAVIVMPLATPVSKITRTASWGAEIVLHGETLAESTAHAAMLAERDGLVSVHPYDDPAIMAGQGTMALEIVEDCGAIDVLVAPIGGGGLIGGCAAVMASLCPEAEIVGVQVAGHDSLSGWPDAERVPLGGATIAEGIAVASVGRAPLAMIRAHVDAVLTVPERVIEDAIALLAEGAKQVSEGAGAAALAGVLAFGERFRGRRVVVPVCGANIDSRILANVLLRNLLRDGRLLRLRMEIPDRPGVLADIATRIGGSGGNIIEVSHQRLFASPSVQNAELEVMVEARDPAHAAEITTALSSSYVVRRG